MKFRSTRKTLLQYPTAVTDMKYYEIPYSVRFTENSNYHSVSSQM